MPPLEMDLAPIRAACPSEAEFAIRGERAADRVIRCHRDGMARPDELLTSLCDLLESDAITIPMTPRLRGWARRIGKAIEQS